MTQSPVEQRKHQWHCHMGEYKGACKYGDPDCTMAASLRPEQPRPTEAGDAGLAGEAEFNSAANFYCWSSDGDRARGIEAMRLISHRRAPGAVVERYQSALEHIAGDDPPNHDSNCDCPPCTAWCALAAKKTTS